MSKKNVYERSLDKLKAGVATTLCKANFTKTELDFSHCESYEELKEDIENKLVKNKTDFNDLQSYLKQFIESNSLSHSNMQNILTYATIGMAITALMVAFIDVSVIPTFWKIVIILGAYAIFFASDFACKSNNKTAKSIVSCKFLLEVVEKHIEKSKQITPQKQKQSCAFSHCPNKCAPPKPKQCRSALAQLLFAPRPRGRKF